MLFAFGGDGGTVDIGLQSLSGAMEGHNSICYDNEAYMNTGKKWCNTPRQDSSLTSPKEAEVSEKTNLKRHANDNGTWNPYVATASVHILRLCQ